MCVCAEDYPAGTWLGDENNPEMRVRCPVSQGDMLHISSNCRTPEKMALTLLDYLFDREVQAISNLSGQGKHGKKQLDPLMIYGIRCEYPTHRLIHTKIKLRTVWWPFTNTVQAAQNHHRHYNRFCIHTLYNDFRRISSDLLIYLICRTLKFSIQIGQKVN